MDRFAIDGALRRIERSVEEIKSLVADDSGGAVLDGGVDLSGIWQGKVMEEDTYEVTLQLHQVGNALSGSIVIFYDNDDDAYFAFQQAAGSVDGSRVRVFGTAVTFMPADPDAEYGLDVFEMSVSDNGREMTGRWTDEDNDPDGRIVVRRPLEV